MMVVSEHRFLLRAGFPQLLHMETERDPEVRGKGLGKRSQHDQTQPTRQVVWFHGLALLVCVCLLTLKLSVNFWN